VPSSLTCTGPSLVTMRNFGAVIPPNKAPSPPIWNMKYHMNQCSFCQFSECQALLHKRKAPLLKTFWTIHWKIYESIQSYIKQLVSLLGFNMAQSWKSLLWPSCGKWTAHCSNIGCLVDHTSPAWALLDIGNNAIYQIFWDQQINSITAIELSWW